MIRDSAFNIGNVFLTILIVSLFSFPNSLSLFKTGVLAIVLVSTLFEMIKKPMNIKSLPTIYYYLSFSLIGILWIIRGAVNANPPQALYDSFKLYVLYSPILCILILTIQNGRYMELLFRCIIISTWIVVLMNLLALSEAIYGIQLLPEWIREEMNIDVSIHLGYTDVSANNINSLFFLIPTIYVMMLSNVTTIKYSKLMMGILLALGLLVSLTSGRRALMLLVFVIPIFSLIQTRLVQVESGVPKKAVALVYILTVIAIALPFALDVFEFSSFVDKITSAFASDTVRVAQYNSLIRGFFENILFGSGFGGSSDIIRSSDPWKYELTYIQLLFNTGLVGTCSVFILVSLFYFMSVISIRRFQKYRIEAVSLLTGLLTFLVAASSNPYFSSFDSLFILGILPLLVGSHAYFGSNVNTMRKLTTRK